jgi:hypothetical protein
MSEDNGGPAFPLDPTRDDYRGMTLRDYFAAKAMQALITGNLASASRDDRSWLEADHWAPSVAYEVADAMLRERNKT